MDNIELYESAIEAKKRYKEEELIDFDEFMDEIEKEYCKNKHSYI